jgi:hypothetical protein
LFCFCAALSSARPSCNTPPPRNSFSPLSTLLFIYVIKILIKILIKKWTYPSGGEAQQRICGGGKGRPCTVGVAVRGVRGGGGRTRRPSRLPALAGGRQQHPRPGLPPRVRVQPDLSRHRTFLSSFFPSPSFFPTHSRERVCVVRVSCVSCHVVCASCVCRVVSCVSCRVCRVCGVGSAKSSWPSTGTWCCSTSRRRSTRGACAVGWTCASPTPPPRASRTRPSPPTPRASPSPGSPTVPPPRAPHHQPPAGHRRV